ncbi:hypothetical protein J5226_11440 [Lysobacter sp. K5869]|uniref:hypothetical protein n=1 Tax=Lysobacter sp. K5869 TaxID=2820808 RepID=UPI001C063663|nr:hypothetical protein [Lysobacter sp. K5869]QWP78956.1 hypothetical protein J5226_11440 [Lysobacter sp. K5869]
MKMKHHGGAHIMNYTRKQIDTLLTFLEPINAYDREETVGELCEKFDLESRASLRELLDRSFFLDPWYSNTAIPVKRTMASTLLTAMTDPAFNFEWLTQDADGTFALPAGVGTGRSRVIYEEIYRAVYDHWNDELQKTDLKLPQPEELDIPPRRSHLGDNAVQEERDQR